MGSHFPTIFYSAPIALTECWWQAMKQLGLTITFYTDSYHRFSPTNPPRLSGDPTRFGGRVNWADKTLVTMVWDWESVKDNRITCLIGVTEQGLCVEYLMIASGLRNPSLEMTPATDAEMLDFMGGLHTVYLFTDDRSETTLNSIVAEGKRAAVSLPESFRCTEFSTGKDGFLIKAGVVQLITGPAIGLDGSLSRRFAAVRSFVSHKKNVEIVERLDHLIKSCGGRAINLNEPTDRDEAHNDQ